MGPKKFWVQANFGFKKCLGSEKIWLEIFWFTQIFGSITYFWIKKISGQKSDPTCYYSSKYLWTKKHFGFPKVLDQATFLIKKKFQNIFW